MIFRLAVSHGTNMFYCSGNRVEKCTRSRLPHASLGKRIYDKLFIYVPTEVARDKTFPFKEEAEAARHIEKKG
jgi:hypothetical protein